MKKLFLSISIFMASWAYLSAQDQAIYTQYMLNPVLINPGATGAGDQHELFLNYRNQWSSIEGAPRNYTISYNGKATDRVGLGFMANAETFGPTRRYRVLLSYAYQIEAENYNLGIGLSTEYHQFNLSGASILNRILDISDVLLQDAADGAQYFDVTVGVFGDIGGDFTFGLSFPNLVRARIDQSISDEETESTSFRYFTLMTGYRFGLDDYGVNILPSVVLKRIYQGPDDIHADLNLLVSFLDEQLLGGVTYQVGAANRIGFIIGTKLNDFNFYYSYDVSTNPLQDYSNGSHELTVGINLSRVSSNQQNLTN